MAIRSSSLQFTEKQGQNKNKGFILIRSRDEVPENLWNDKKTQNISFLDICHRIPEEPLEERKTVSVYWRP